MRAETNTGCRPYLILIILLLSGALFWVPRAHRLAYFGKYHILAYRVPERAAGQERDRRFNILLQQPLT